MENRPLYTKEESLSFIKLVDPYIIVYGKTDKLKVLLENEDYYGYVLKLVFYMDKRSNYMKSYSDLMQAPLDEMPLLVNNLGLSGEIAKWRLQIGK